MAKNLRRSLFIGLGGTGIKSILKTKAILLDNYGKDDKLPPFFAFLGIDTDAEEYGSTSKSLKMGEVSLSAREKVSISVANPDMYFQNHKQEMTWMPRKNEKFILTLDRGAGQVRTNGRLAFVHQLTTLKTRLLKALNDVNSSSTYDNYQALSGDGTDGVAKTEVHVVFSLCGGTGSGTFLDVAYLLREIIREQHMNVTLNGYGVLPGVFLDEITDPTEKSRIEPNAYGALRDLDYLMSLPSEGRLCNIAWQNRETNVSPFDSLVLVDNVNTEGVHYKKMTDLTDMLSLALLATTGQIGSKSKSVGDNVKYDVINKAFDVDDKCAWVSAIGTSAIIYSGESVAKIQELKTQNRLIDLIIGSSDEDCNVLANQWINVARIREDQGKNHVTDRLYDISEITEPVLSEKDFDKRNVSQKVNSKMEKYQQAYMLSSDTWNARVDEFFEEVKTKLVEKEKELCKKSLYLVKEFLSEIKTQISDYSLEEMKSEFVDKENERREAKTDFDSRLDLLAGYLNKIGLHRQVNTYINALKQHYYDYVVADIEAKRRSYAIEFYSKLIDFIDSEISKFGLEISKLQSIKNDNDTRIRDIQNRKKNSRKTVIIDLADEHIRLIGAVEKVNVVDFIETLPGKSLYGSLEQSEYESILVAYTADLEECKSTRTKTIDDVLEGMTKEEFDDVIIRAANYSKPFLNINDRGIQLKATGLTLGTQEQYYICVPNAETCRLTVNDYFQDIIASTNAQKISTGIEDRIIIYRQKRPIPPLGISSLETWKDKYDLQKDVVSFHFDEQMRKRMDEDDYSFFPKKSNQDEAVNAWTMGCILGLIKFDKGTYWYHDATREIITGPDDQWVNTQSAFRDKAFEEFRTCVYILKQYTDKFNNHLKMIGDIQKAELLTDVKAHYFDKYSRCQLTHKTVNSMTQYEETKKLLTKENKCIDYIFKL